MKQLFSGLAVAAMLAAPVVAQQTSGSITATVDLEERAWSVGASETGAVQSGWRPEDGAVRVTLVGGSDMKKAGAMTMEFVVRSPDTEAVGDDLTVTLPQEAGEALVATPENSNLTITAVNRQGGDMVVSGDFSGVMVPGGPDRLVQADAEGAVTIDGNFQATVQQAGAD